MAFIESELAVNTKADALAALHAGGIFRVFGGSEPASLADPDSPTFLGEVFLESPAFTIAVAGLLTLILPASTTWSANGTATHYRTYSSSSPELPLGQGSVGVGGSGADAIINSTTAVAGGALSLLSYDYQEPQS